MEARAITRYVRLSPRKARLVADLVRGKSALQALDILEFTNKKQLELFKRHWHLQLQMQQITLKWMKIN